MAWIFIPAHCFAIPRQAARELTDKVYGGAFASKAGYLGETGEAMMFQPGLRVKAKEGKGDVDVAAAAAATAGVLAAGSSPSKVAVLAPYARQVVRELPSN